MGRQVKTNADILRFKENASEAGLESGYYDALLARLNELHKVYDEAQGYATMVLKREEDNSRFLCIKYIAGFAIAMAVQEDEILEDFLKYGSRKTAFWEMVEYESQLRQFEKGQLTEKGLEDLRNRLGAYRGSNVKMTKACSEASWIGTCLLYPFMAVAHNYNEDKTDKQDFKEILKNFYKTGLNFDVTPVMDIFDEPLDQVFAKGKLNGFINENIIKTILAEKKDATTPNSVRSRKAKVSSTNKEIDDVEELMQKVEARMLKILTTDVKNGTEQFIQPQDNLNESMSATEVLIEEPIIVDNAEDEEKQEVKDDNMPFDEREEYFNYANFKFVNSEDFGKVRFDSFYYSTTQTVMGKVSSQKNFYPFELADSVQAIKKVYNNMDGDLQAILLQTIYKDTAIRLLQQDIKNFDKLDDQTKYLVKELCKCDDNWNTILQLSEHKINKRAQDQKNKDIRRLARFVNRDGKDDYYFGIQNPSSL